MTPPESLGRWGRFVWRATDVLHWTFAALFFVGIWLQGYAPMWSVVAAFATGVSLQFVRAEQWRREAIEWHTRARALYAIALEATKSPGDDSASDP